MYGVQMWKMVLRISGGSLQTGKGLDDPSSLDVGRLGSILEIDTRLCGEQEIMICTIDVKSSD
jgi:hypothetical protein